MRSLMWLSLLVMTGVVSALATHHVSQSHYLQLGKNSGSIDARVAVIRKIDAVLPRARTCSESEYKDWKEIVSVKSGAVYVKPISDATVMICVAH